MSVTVYFIFTDEKIAEWYLNERVIAKRSSFPMLKRQDINPEEWYL